MLGHTLGIQFLNVYSDTCYKLLQQCRALEEKKRAMAVAEEQRRQKALEERRKAQHEATARFKSAIVRMKSNPTRPKNKPGENLESMLSTSFYFRACVTNIISVLSPSYQFTYQTRLNQRTLQVLKMDKYKIRILLDHSNREWLMEEMLK